MLELGAGGPCRAPAARSRGHHRVGPRGGGRPGDGVDHGPAAPRSARRSAWAPRERVQTGLHGRATGRAVRHRVPDGRRVSGCRGRGRAGGDGHGSRLAPRIEAAAGLHRPGIPAGVPGGDAGDRRAPDAEATARRFDGVRLPARLRAAIEDRQRQGPSGAGRRALRPEPTQGRMAGKYTWFDPAPDSTHNMVLGLVPERTRVLEFGCATGYVSAELTNRLGCTVTG